MTMMLLQINSTQTNVNFLQGSLNQDPDVYYKQMMRNVIDYPGKSLNQEFQKIIDIN